MQSYYVVKGCFYEKNDCEYIYVAFDGGRALELFRRFSISKGNRTFTGFENLIPLWSDSFKKEVGMSPKEYKNKIEK